MGIKEKGIAALLLLASAVIAIAGDGTARLTKKERAIAFVVEHELKSAQLGRTSDVCVGFGLAVNEARIVSAVGHGVHRNDWCNRGPRGLNISVLAPVKEPVPGTFELEVETGDYRPIVREGAHFATLLRRGVYTVRCSDAVGPELVEYSPKYPSDKGPTE